MSHIVYLVFNSIIIPTDMPYEQNNVDVKRNEKKKRTKANK